MFWLGGIWDTNEKTIEDLSERFFWGHSLTGRMR